MIRSPASSVSNAAENSGPFVQTARALVPCGGAAERVGGDLGEPAAAAAAPHQARKQVAGTAAVPHRRVSPFALERPLSGPHRVAERLVNDPERRNVARRA